MKLKQRHLGAIILAAAFAVHGAPAMSAMEVWNFNSWRQDLSGSGAGNSLALSGKSGTELSVTGWSDTSSSGVESAELTWANKSSLGTRNSNETGGLPDSAVDSVTSDSSGGFDMILLEFDTAVNLAGLDINWAVGGSSSDTADISILAWNGTGDGSLTGGSWAEILAGGGGSYDSVGNFTDVDLSYFSIDSSITSTKWLVGAYNPVFGKGGDAGDDGITLAGITTETDAFLGVTDSEVPVPGTLFLLLPGLLWLRLSRTA